MKKIILSMVAIAMLAPTFAQKEIKYLSPPPIVSDDIMLKVEDAVSVDEYSKLKLIVENKSSDLYFVYNTDKTGFNFESLGGIFYPNKAKEMIIAPGEKKSRVVKTGDKNNDYRVNEFTLKPGGLKSGYIPQEGMSLPQFTMQVGSGDETDLAGLKVVMEPLSEKKDKVSTSIKLEFNGNKNELILVDPSKLEIVTSDGKNITAEFGPKKAFELRPGDDKNIKISFQANANALSLSWGAAVKFIALEEVEMSDIQISAVSKPSKPVTVKVKRTKTEQPKSDKKREKAAPIQTPVVAAHTPSCNPYKGSKEAPCKFSIQNDGGHCFKLDVDGFPVITDFASVAIIYVDYGRRKMNFTFADGTTVEEKTFVTDNYDALGVKIKRNKKGEYNVKNDLGAQVLSAKGQQARDDQMASTKANREAAAKSLDEPIVVDKPSTSMLDKTEFESDKKPEPEKTAPSGGASSSSSSGTSGCYGAFTTGSTTVKLKVTWKGKAVSNNGIQIKIGGSSVGVGETDGSGIAEIKTGSLPIRKIDVYGCNGGGKWSVTGDWCVLDGSNYFHLKLDEVAAFMGEMMGMTADQIGSGWGM